MWRPCRDYVGHPGALSAASDGYNGPFGGYVETMFGNVWLCWRFLGATSGHLEAMLGLCWAPFGSLGDHLVPFGGFVGSFGAYIGTIVGSLRLCCSFLKAMLGHLEPMLGLCWAPWGSLGGI